MQPIINRQISDLKESATLFINQLALKLRSEGQDICHLGFGESPFPVPEPMHIQYYYRMIIFRNSISTSEVNLQEWDW